MTDTSKEAVEALIESRWAYRAPDAAPAILLRALMAERDELQAQLQDQALSHLSAMGQLTDQLSAPAHAAKVLLGVLKPITDDDARGKAHSLISYRNGYSLALSDLRAIAEQEGE
ncbi:MAG: hypothetical protein Unbinned7865contig1001_1 [Prokaryotic dsDNA virus sp.]|nr:MAG: hypothetical protein Unbinned7865contig1001_1 [Prokaryotic dsDNA virus sp.]|tara:strand:- start:20244 stop:20588 length:345 start_codon:yes stop_codon:yes gene_type:complete